MKRLILFVVLAFTFLISVNSYSQVRIRGSFQSSLYSWERDNDSQEWDFYEGLQFRISPENYSNLYLNTYLRAAYRGEPAEWGERVYNLYGNWNAGKNYRFRVGRQFVHDGVINGTVDAVQLTGKFLNKFKVRGIVGTEAPFDRELKLKDWDNGNVLGGYLGYNYRPRYNFELSYFQKQRFEELYWQQIGSAVHGYVNDELNYYVRFDYNLLSKQYQTVRARVSYYGKIWIVTAELNSYKPRIYEDSFFNIFQLEAYNQIRTAVTYRWKKKYDIGLQYLQTAYNAHEFYIAYKEDDMDHRIIGTFGSPYGTIGLIYQTGNGGENVGYFGELKYEFIKNLTARVYNSYYNYERATTNISEDALSFSAGLSYRLKNMFIIRGELQQSSNSYYENDTRGLLRLTYLFNY